MVQRSDRIKKPDVVAKISLVEIAEVRIHRVIIEIDVLIGIASGQPRFLHADGRIVNLRRQLGQCSA